MLFKQTLKVASAAALWMVALLGANSAMAVDLDKPSGTANPPLVYSAETLKAKAATAPGYAIEGKGLEVTGALGTIAALLSRSAPIYIRVEFGGVLVLSGSGDGPNLVVSSGPKDKLAPGNEATFPKDGYLLYSVGGDSATKADTTMTLNLEKSVAVKDRGPGTVTVRAYADVRDALLENAPLFTKTATLVNVASSVTVNARPNETLTAGVEGGFLQFTPVALAVNLGGFSIDVDKTHLDAAGDLLEGDFTGVNGVNIDVAKSTATFSSDGGFAWADAVSLAGVDESGGCNSSGPAIDFEKNADGDALKDEPLVGDVEEKPVKFLDLCATIKTTNASPIQASTVMLDVVLAAADADRGAGKTRPFPPQGAKDLPVGTIARNGTSVNIPYITSYEGYTQRLIIVNRNKHSVAYTLTVNLEGDGTATPAGPFEGMAAGDSATVVKVADEVTLTNPTRASATLDVVSSASKIDVATTTVNKMDQSTDTVVLHLGGTN